MDVVKRVIDNIEQTPPAPANNKTLESLALNIIKLLLPIALSQPDQSLAVFHTGRHELDGRNEAIEKEVLKAGLCDDSAEPESSEDDSSAIRRSVKRLCVSL